MTMIIDISITGVDTFRICPDEPETEAKRSSRVKSLLRSRRKRQHVNRDWRCYFRCSTEYYIYAV